MSNLVIVSVQTQDQADRIRRIVLATGYVDEVGDTETQVSVAEAVSLLRQGASGGGGKGVVAQVKHDAPAVERNVERTDKPKQQQPKSEPKPPQQ